MSFQIKNIQFKHNIWNAPVQCSTIHYEELNNSDSGAVVIKTQTLLPNKGNPDKWQVIQNANGKIHSKNNIALDNPGLNETLKNIRSINFNKPVIVSVKCDTVDEANKIGYALKKFSLRREVVHGVMIELNISCPNVKITVDTNQQSALLSDVEILKALKTSSELLVGLKLSCKQITLYTKDVNCKSIINYCDFVTVINTIKGEGGTHLFDYALQSVVELHHNFPNIPIIACGGISTISDVSKMIAAGAKAIEIGSAYLLHGTSVFSKGQTVINHLSSKKQQYLKDCLTTRGIIQRGIFKLKSGAISNIYCDCRQIYSHPELFDCFARLAAQYLVDEKVKDKIDIVVGVPMGGLPLATAIAMTIKKPLVILRKNKKTHGNTSQMISGVYKKGDRCLLVEDTITTAGSAYNAKKTLMTYGIMVPYLFCIIDRRNDIIARPNSIQRTTVCSLIQMPNSHRDIFNSKL